MPHDQISGVPARERLLDVAYELFCRRGVRAVGIEELLDRAGVAKATLYKHFPAKEDLVREVLRLREERWTTGMVQAEALRRGQTPRAQLLAIFDAFDDWFRTDGFEACSFINVLLEMGPDHPLGRASVAYLENIRTFVQGLAEEAELRDAAEFARCWHILMKGSIIAAAEGDVEAARRAKKMASGLIESHAG